MEGPQQSSSRREFVARTVAAVAAVPVLSSLPACAPASTEAPAPAPAPSAAPAAAPPREEDPMLEPLLEIVRAKYGSRLTAAQLDEVREGIAGNLRAAKALREFEIPMHVEPSCLVSAYRREGR